MISDLKKTVGLRLLGLSGKHKNLVELATDLDQMNRQVLDFIKYGHARKEDLRLASRLVHMANSYGFRFSYGISLSAVFYKKFDDDSNFETISIYVYNWPKKISIKHRLAVNSQIITDRYVYIMEDVNNLLPLMAGLLESLDSNNPNLIECEVIQDALDPWVEFMSGSVNIQGFSLSDVLSYDHIDMDNKHGFIQWIFPNKLRSPINDKAPLLNDGYRKIYNEKEIIRSAVNKSLNHYLKFLGLAIEFDRVRYLDEYNSRGVLNWRVDENHNHKRITRMLNFLVGIGLERTAESICTFLCDEIEKYGINCDQAVRHWVAAQSQVGRHFT